MGSRKKKKTNIAKHSVSFSKAMSIFDDPLELTISDPGHSEGEYRYISIGMSVDSSIIISFIYRARRLHSYH